MHRLNRSLLFWLLEIYALLLTLLQLAGGLRTDEAKYLLSIPYPHPPLLRLVFALTANFPYQEFLWRFLIASAVVQGAWFLFDLGYVLPKRQRSILQISWLLSAAVIVQAGTIMMAPLTGLFGLICTWLALRPTPIKRTSASLVGCLWFAGIFSAYQCVLFLPLIVSILRSAHVSWKKILFLTGVPLLLLVLYTATNPLIVASFLKVATQDAPLAFAARAGNVAWISLLAGSGALTLAGVIGILTGGRLDFLLTFAAVLAFIALTSQYYYAILLTPLFIAGLFLLLCRRRVPVNLYLPAFLILSVIFTGVSLPPLAPTSARETVAFLQKNNLDRFILIDGNFGHEWQYESTGRIGKYSQDLSSSVESEATAIVCTKKTCEEEIDGEQWVKIPEAPIEVWKRKSQ